MFLEVIPSTHIDKAWGMGASSLARACDASGGEITGDQLKMILARGERTLIAMRRGESIDGWGVVRIDQLPNMRVLMVTDMVAPHGRFQEFLDELKKFADAHGCSRVRCAAKPAQARLYESRAGFKPVYQILEVLV